MFSFPERLLAWRYMRAKRREGFVSIITAFSVLGIMLGVATLILVTSLMNGIREEMISNFVGIDGHITLVGDSRVIRDSRAVLAMLEGGLQGSGVLHVGERIEGQVMASSAGRALGAQVFGLHSEDLSAKKRIAENVSTGGLQRFSDNKGLLLGERLMQNLGLQVGQSVTLISPQGRATFAGVVPRIKSYPIAGSFKVGMHALDASLIILPYDEARIYFGLPESEAGVASAIELTLADAEAVPVVIGRVKQLLRNMPQAFRIYDWQQSNQSVLTALDIQRDVMLVILTLIILVAAFNIISSLIMLVQDKTREVAILRSMGASRGSVLRIFLLSGMSIGMVGTMTGILLGLLAAAYIDSIRKGLEMLLGQKILVENVYFLSSLPTKTDPGEVLMVGLLALALSFLSTLYPAWKAASTSPAEALRYE